MSKLEELIKQLCPNGVKYKRLDEVFESFNGMTGVSNKWKENGNCQFIEYMNAYKNLKINIKLLPFATVKNLQQNTLQKGDILLTCASETPDECAVSSVIEDEIKDNVFLDDHLFGIRVKKNMKSEINTTFINYYMHTNNFRKKINKAVRGVTRFYISIDEFMKICIPIPPLEVQCEIVHILDDFTLLSAELKARQKQYNYYRDKEMLNAKNVVKYKLNEIAEIYDGTHQTPKYTDSGIDFISVENIKDIYNSKKYISIDDYNKYKIKPKLNDIFMTRIGTIGKCTVFNKQKDLAYYVSLALIRPNNNIVDSYYLKYLIESIIGIKELRKKTLVNAVPIKINKDDIGKLVLPIPPLEEQKRIVNILDRFDKLCNNISEDIPAEIEARQKQYEYYRDKLLTFKELKVNE